MSKLVIVTNTGNKPVLVGARYLLPGERREVLETHYLSAKKRSGNALALPKPAAKETKLEVAAQVTAAEQAVEPADVEPEAPPAPPKPKRRRSSN